MSWSKDQVSLLIEEYQKYPCLYAVKSNVYRNKHARNAAIGARDLSPKKSRPNVTPQEIKNKFQALKTNFLNEHRRHVESLKSGAGQDQVYMPSIWYFKNMRYILDHVDVRTSYDSSQYLETESAPQYEEPSNDVEVEEIDEFSYMTSEESKCSEASVESPKLRKKKKMQEEPQDLLIRQASTALSTLSQTFAEAQSKNKIEAGTEEAFGSYVVAKMKEISNPVVKSDVEEKITLLLFDGIKKCRNNLS